MKLKMTMTELKTCTGRFTFLMKNTDLTIVQKVPSRVSSMRQIAVKKGMQGLMCGDFALSRAGNQDSRTKACKKAEFTIAMLACEDENLFSTRLFSPYATYADKKDIVLYITRKEKANLWNFYNRQLEFSANHQGTSDILDAIESITYNGEGE